MSFASPVLVGFGVNVPVMPGGAVSSSETGLAEGSGLAVQVTGILICGDFVPGARRVLAGDAPSRKLLSGGEDGGS